MTESDQNVRTWLKVGVITGLLATLTYSLLITVSMPLVLTVVLAGAFGPLLAVASLGLYHYMAAHRRTVSLQIAVVLNVIAGTLVSTMLIVQIGLREFMMRHLRDAADAHIKELIQWSYSAADKVQLGLDVSWDIYICLGTILFAVNMWRHPSFGKAIGAAGVAIGAALLALNLASFPEPPAESGSIDLGPLIGLWYLAAAILMIRALMRMGGSPAEHSA